MDTLTAHLHYCCPPARVASARDLLASRMLGTSSNALPCQRPSGSSRSPGSAVLDPSPAAGLGVVHWFACARFTGGRVVALLYSLGPAGGIVWTQVWREPVLVGVQIGAQIEWLHLAICCPHHRQNMITINPLPTGPLRYCCLAYAAGDGQI